MMLFVHTLYAQELESDQNNSTSEFKVSDQAIKLARNSIIIDGHIDVPHRIFKQWVDVTEGTDDGDFDYPRAKAGGLNAPFMSIYVPASLDGTIASTQRAHQLIDSVEALVFRAPEKLAIATSPAQVEEQFKRGLISLPLGMENGAPISDDLNNLRVFYDRGIRYITLAHFKSNNISDSSYDEIRRWGGLSTFGKSVVTEMNQLGIMVDVSHVSDEAFYDVLDVSNAPVIASHSSLRFFTPGFERNMSDDMVKALAENGGVIMINFGSAFVDGEARRWTDQRSAGYDKAIKEFGAQSEQVASFNFDYRVKIPFPFAEINNVLDQFDYVVQLVGVDYVGIGSDYDGVGDTLPRNLKDVASYPKLVQGLLDRDYSEDDVKKILGENLLRVWKEVELIARQ